MSLQIRKYYFQVVVPMVSKGLLDVGYREVKTDSDAHFIIKNLFIKKKPTQEEPTTKDFTNKEWMQFISEVQQWGSEFLSVVIPDPNQDQFL